MSGSLARHSSGVAPFRRGTVSSGKVILLIVVTISIILVNLFVHPSRFADYDSYVQFTDYIYHYSEFSWIYFEPLPSFILFMLRSIASDTEKAVNISHGILGLIFILINYYIIRNNKVNWQGYLIFLALYGSLLAFVTFRATAAYLLVTIAFFDAMEGKKRSYVCILVSSLFHISALLAFPLIVILFYESKFDFIKKISFNKYFVIFLGLLISILYGIYGNLLSLTFVNIVSNVSFLAKYIAYTTEIDSVSGAILDSGQDRRFHFVYALSISLFTISIMLSKNENCIRIRNAVIAGYLMFLVMQFSPVTAFRQSIFWMTPAVLIFPWSKLHFRKYGVVPFVVMCIGLMAYQFQSAYS